MLNIFYIYFTFFVILLFLTFMAMALLMSVMQKTVLLNVSLPILETSNFPMNLELSVNTYSLLFSMVVLFIASVMTLFSYYYFSNSNFKSVLFLFMKFFFVLSMLTLINFSDLFFIMLGWDGLGFVSFLLIMFYQSDSSIASALFTIMMNRLGDGFLLLSLSLLSLYSYSFYSYCLTTTSSKLILLFMLLAFMTKSALFPFSSWLPIAMAAPTPISALVHSSTLVTAGLFLMMRFSFFFYYSYELMKILFMVSVFTSLYAGLASLVEKDLKKMIALSTLSHLGFISMSFSLGLMDLAFFHLLSHALFKSLLFMSMGDMIKNFSHSQDSRYISSSFNLCSYSNNLMRISLLNLLGLPSLSGFYSKDLILEFMLFNVSSIWMYLLVLINVLLTFYYTIFLMSFSFTASKTIPLNHFSIPSSIYLGLATVLSLFCIVFGYMCLKSNIFFLDSVTVPSMLKFIPQVLLLVMIMVNIMLPGLSLPLKKQMQLYFSSMLHLHFIIMKSSSFFLVYIVQHFYKVVEMGFLNNLLNKESKSFVKTFSLMMINYPLKSSHKVLILYSLTMAMILLL